MQRAMSRLTAGLVVASLTIAACGGGDADDATTDNSGDTSESTSDASGIRIVAPTEAAELIADPADDLVILDVRTQEEFSEGHIDGAVMIDFYRDDFAEQLAGLDPDVPYVLYCRSGNRSGQTRAIMSELGFTSVADIEGGIVNWQSAGLDVTE